VLDERELGACTGQERDDGFGEVRGVDVREGRLQLLGQRNGGSVVVEVLDVEFDLVEEGADRGADGGVVGGLGEMFVVGWGREEDAGWRAAAVGGVGERLFRVGAAAGIVGASPVRLFLLGPFAEDQEGEEECEDGGADRGAHCGAGDGSGVDSVLGRAGGGGDSICAGGSDVCCEGAAGVLVILA
jgi:hypothetical protein